MVTISLRIVSEFLSLCESFYLWHVCVYSVGAIYREGGVNKT